MHDRLSSNGISYFFVALSSQDEENAGSHLCTLNVSGMDLHLSQNYFLERVIELTKLCM